MLSSILLVYSTFEELPSLYLIPSDSEFYKSLLDADGYVVNNNDDDYDAATQSFVQNLYTSSLAAYELPTNEYLELHEAKIINIGFAP